MSYHIIREIQTAVIYKLALAMGAWHLPRWECLPPQGLNHVLLQLLTSNTFWRSSEWRAGMTCSVRWENWQDRSFFRYSQELIFWAQFLYLIMSKKAWKSFMVMIISCNQQKLHKTSRNFLQKKYVVDCMDFPFTKITYILSLPLTSLEQFLRAIIGAVSQAAVLILPQWKLNSQLSCCTFL